MSLVRADLYHQETESGSLFLHISSLSAELYSLFGKYKEASHLSRQGLSDVKCIYYWSIGRELDVELTVESMSFTVSE